MSSHEHLVEIACTARAAWEVERIIVGCALPEDILRVPRGSRTDLTVLKAAWKKLAFHVHPDKCRAVGSADAMAIARDAFELLMLRADVSNSEEHIKLAGIQGNTSSYRNSASGNTTADFKPYGPPVHGTEDLGATEDSRCKISTEVGRSEDYKLPPLPPQPLKVRVKLKAVAKKV